MEKVPGPFEAVRGSEFSPPVRACIIYQDHACANQAAEFRQELERTYGRAETNSWSFESLRVPAVRHAATVDAVGSRLLIVAAREGTELPSYLKFWIGSFLGSRSDDACTVVALLNTNETQTPDDGPVQRYLHTIARLDGMEFICRKNLEKDSNTERRRETKDAFASAPFHAVMAGGLVFEDVGAFHQLQ